jgi:hypothetical protein
VLYIGPYAGHESSKSILPTLYQTAMIFYALFLFLLVAFVVIHMTRPRFERLTLSAARFFHHLQPPQKPDKRINFGNPFKSLPFYIQLPILLLLLVAVITAQQSVQGGGIAARQVGMWLLVDTSASMSALDSGKIRSEIVRPAVRSVLSAARANAAEARVPLCARLSTFDLERRDIIPSTADLTAIERAVEQIDARPLGTDLSLLQKLALAPNEAISEQETTGDVCPVTHLVVISDLPAPEWAANQEGAGIIWMDIASEVKNAGITAIHALRDPITAKVYQVQVELANYGSNDQRTMRVTDPQGQVLAETAVEWGRDTLWQGSFQPLNSGPYHVQILPEDAYRFDDNATVDITAGSDLRVDWQHPDRSLLALLPWQQDSQSPLFRVVTSFSDLTGKAPELLVGPGYTADGLNREEIRYFVEGHALIRDLNFDAAVEVGNAGQSIPEGFDPVLAGETSTWVALRTSPPAVYVPGLPQGEGNLNAFSTTVFFNAVRWLLQTGPQPPLYTLTTPQQPLPEGNRIALHEEEGNTARLPVSMGSLDELRPAAARTNRQPIWPMLVFAATLFFLFERFLFVKGGSQWR